MNARQTNSISELIHEMRNQLAVAKANLEAFVDGKLPPTAERLQSVLQTLSQLEELIKDLRVLRPELEEHAGFAEINVCSLLQREYAALEGAAVAKGVTMSVYRCPHPNAACQRFYGDPVRIGQIVTNVLLNAVRYTPKGGSIAVDCRRRADELQIMIQDSGRGISQADAQHIFEPGYRGEAARSNEGSGLGLSLVKRFVEDHGGSVTLGETSDQGATFVLRLPGKLPASGHGAPS
jgi:two-component system sensor histidine kinase BaeS